MVKIETCICDSTLDVRKRERYCYEELNANLNTNRPHTTSEETKLDRHEYEKQYKIDSEASIKQYKKQYRIDNEATI
jgi:hypothetical protein